METARSSETSMNFYPNIPQNNPKDSRHYKNINSSTEWDALEVQTLSQ
jgi:hypothetical protein